MTLDTKQEYLLKTKRKFSKNIRNNLNKSLDCKIKEGHGAKGVFYYPFQKANLNEQNISNLKKIAPEAKLLLIKGYHDYFKRHDKYQNIQWI